jgi:hypothetical protein
MAVKTCDAHDLEAGEAAVVILDPPWYLDFLRPMLAAAAAACRFGGHVLISLPPSGVRPSAQRDRSKILYWAERQGLLLLSEDRARLSYDMPFFESNALAAAGVTNVPADWRRGDLVVFRKFGRREVTPNTTSVRKERWREVSIGRMRLFIGMDSPIDSTADPVLRPIVAGEVMPSVSRRDPRRRSAVVWTSGNRAFTTGRPDLVMRAAMAYAVGHSRSTPGGIDGRDIIQRLGYTLREIAEREEIEAQSVGTSNGGTTWGIRWESTSTISLDGCAATLFG